jgi:ketosteroid isomerase-like protein
MSWDAEQEARLRRLEDIEEIRDLTLRYREHLDARDLVAYAALFAEDGVWEGRTGSARTPAGIQAMLEERLAPNPPAPGPTTFHVVSDPVIAVAGDTGTGYSQWMHVTRSAEDTPTVPTLGHYDDEYVRENGAWKFARRVAAIDIPQQ